jgi:hypothetical protein
MQELECALARSWFWVQVSGPKRRFKDDGYNLDLTYVTPRLIAFGYDVTRFDQMRI